MTDSDREVAQATRMLATIDLAEEAGRDDGLAWYANLVDGLADKDVLKEVDYVLDDSNPDYRPHENLLDTAGVAAVAKSWGVEPDTELWRGAMQAYDQAWRRAVRVCAETDGRQVP